MRKTPDTTGGPARTAGQYRRHASRQYGYATTQATTAAHFYQHARTAAAGAAWLTDRPSLWTADYNPAVVEAEADTFERMADVYLRAHFMYVDQARFYAGLARDYEAIAASLTTA